MIRSNEQKIWGIHYQTNKPIELTIEDGYITSQKEIEKENSTDYILAPGFVDIQINGYKGYDFNDKPLNLEEWDTVVKELLDVGVTTFYPTIITNSIEELTTIFEKNIEVFEKSQFVNSMIGGFHLEGPYLSPMDGPRGAHNKDYIKTPNWKEFFKLQEIAKGKIKIITLSPEWEESIEFIEKVTNTGVKVAIGHTAANTNQISRAVQAGTVLSTHLGNGAHVTLPRHPNYIWDQLAEDDLWASIISDGHHLPMNVIKVFNKVKQDKMFLVSDSVALAGMKPGDYEAAVGGSVTLTDDGRLHLKDQPNLLAGSAQNLLQGVENLVKSKISTFSNAIDKASVIPGKFMGIKQKDGLKVGAPADILQMDCRKVDWKIIHVWKNGIQRK
ncbi:amidohydrolase family protein [Pseudogracilibacillus sp. SE30717A]|uniref:N-acetylglucosamine-6-phosphate deacetylase n=1 Tax=Pseudogracilibacillus sp. SE30717A TaxID=3098293 RepID=UPI00300DE6A0